MTQHTISVSAPGGATASAHRSLQGIEHGYVEHVHVDRRRADRPAKQRFSLWKWFPAELEHSGRRTSRDSERGYRDLQAARDRADW